MYCCIILINTQSRPLLIPADPSIRGRAIRTIPGFMFWEGNGGGGAGLGAGIFNMIHTFDFNCDILLFTMVLCYF